MDVVRQHVKKVFRALAEADQIHRGLKKGISFDEFLNTFDKPSKVKLKELTDEELQKLIDDLQKKLDAALRESRKRNQPKKK